MRALGSSVLSVGLILSPAFGQPREWSDDFKTVRTYDSASLYASCSSGPSTKYTILDPLGGDVFNQRSVSGGGKFTFTNRALTGVVGRIDMAVIGVMDLGQDCPDNPDPTPGASLSSSEPFTSSSVCLYGGIEFNPWQLRTQGGDSFSTLGSDGKPGIANIDDDLDGTTDEADEAVAARPTTVGGGYGNGNGTGYQAGQDAAPGVAGVDDDGNGVVDDIGENGWPGSDDGDDRSRHIWWVILRADLNAMTAMYLNLDPGGTNDGFALREVNGVNYPAIENADEINYGFFSAYTRYNWMFCGVGSCYGASLWTGPDMANPDETLGPSMNSNNLDPDSNLVALGFIHNLNTVQFNRKMRYRGNSNFSDRFWVISGNPQSYYPSPSPDLDNDKDVDGFDFLTFSNCYNGSNRLPLAACGSSLADLDWDGDVDGFDFLTFSNCYNGSNRRPLAACFPPGLASVTNCLPPANDTCATAQEIGEGVFPGEITSAADSSLACATEGGRDVWYKYTPTCTGTATITTCDRTGLPPAVLGFDIEISVFNACGGAALVGPCYDADACSPRMESVTVSVSAGVPVYIAVQGTEAQYIGQFILTVSCGS